MEPAVDYLAGDGPPPCFLYFGTFQFVRTLQRVERDSKGELRLVQLSVYYHI